MNDKTEVVRRVWQAHRTLAESLPGVISELLHEADLELSALDGIVCYQGPGSFTGLRIGIAAANALAYAQKLPIVGTTGEQWVLDGIRQIQSGDATHIVLPEYGAAPHTT